MQYALRLLPREYKDYVYCAELIYEYFSFLESGVPIANFDHYKLSKNAKIAACKFGIKATKKCNGILTPVPYVLWSKNYGITKTMLHSCFDETSNDITRFGQIRQYGTKTFENFLKDLRGPTLQCIKVGASDWYSQCTKVFGDDLSHSMTIEYNMYVLYFFCLYN